MELLSSVDLMLLLCSQWLAVWYYFLAFLKEFSWFMLSRCFLQMIPLISSFLISQGVYKNSILIPPSPISTVWVPAPYCQTYSFSNPLPSPFPILPFTNHWALPFCPLMSHWALSRPSMMNSPPSLHKVQVSLGVNVFDVKNDVLHSQQLWPLYLPLSLFVYAVLRGNYVV